MPRLAQAASVAGPKYPASSAAASGVPMRGRDGLEGGLGFLAVVGVIGERASHDEQTPLIHGHLRVVILLKAGIRRVFHDARLRVGEVVLVAVTGPGTGGVGGRPPGRRPVVRSRSARCASLAS